MTDPKRTADDRFARFKEHLRAQRLKSTAQRDTIVKAFLNSQRHISVEELYNDVRRLNPHIGYATVYRTMKLLTECGVAAERHFRDGEARYEVRFHAPLAEFPTADDTADTARLVRVLEGFIRAAPEQYLWNHRRFKGRPAPLPDLYARPKA